MRWPGPQRCQMPRSKALEGFLLKAKAGDPVPFPDLSLTIIKLMARANTSSSYLERCPGPLRPGGQGLYPRHRAQSPLPRPADPALVKSGLAGKPVPYSPDELEVLAAHCTEAEDAAKKVERQVGKAARRCCCNRDSASSLRGLSPSRRGRQRDLGAAAHPAGGRETGQRLCGRRRRRPGARPVDLHRRSAGLY